MDVSPQNCSNLKRSERFDLNILFSAVVFIIADEDLSAGSFKCFSQRLLCPAQVAEDTEGLAVQGAHVGNNVVISGIGEANLA